MTIKTNPHEPASHHPEPANLESPDGTPSATGARVLIVEDDPGQAQTISDVLEIEGFKPLICTTAAAGLTAASGGSFAIAIIDLNLPDAAGSEFLADILATDPRIKVVVHTGYSSLDSAVAAVNLGAFGYIEKGRNPIQLVQIAHRAAHAYVSEQLVDAREKLQRIADNAPQLIAYLSRELRYQFVNERYCEWTSLPNDQIIGRSVRDVLGAAVYAFLEPNLTQALAGEATEFVSTGDFPDPRGRHITGSYLPDFDGDGAVRGIFVFVTDETKRRETERALRKSEATFRAVFERAGIGIVLTDTNGTVIDSNQTLQRMLGFPEDELNALHSSDFIHQDDLEEDRKLMRLLRGRMTDHYTMEQRLFRKDGGQMWTNVVVSAVRDADDEIPFFIAMIEDISEKKRMSEELSYQARHDPLTGLVNRRAFEERLQRVLSGQSDPTSEHALCYLDMDQFKIINDSCGHAAGDELLRQLGTLLPSRVRKRDTLARLGGDEFGILMEHCPLEQAERVADSIRLCFEEFRFHWDNKSFQVGASIGLVPIAGGETTVADVLSAADAACYAAKESGRNRIHVYRPDDDDLKRRHREMQWATRLGRALDDNRFELHFQPIVPINKPVSDGAHYEMLLRLRDDDGRLINPGAFLGAAERYNLAVRIDQWVINRAFEWLSSDRDRLDSLSLCAINLSGQSLGDDALLDFVLDRIDRFAIPGDRLCFEITETAMVGNLPRAQKLIRTLRSKDIRFALDDFGSGLSSFAYLKSLPVDFLKIDGLFVKDIVEDRIDRAMVKSINEIGHVMGKQTIAEFVENDAIMEELRIIGVDYGQGFGIGKPVPLS